MADTYEETYLETYGTEGVTVDNFRKHVGASLQVTSDETLEHILVSATLLIDNFLGTRASKVPTEIYDTAILWTAQQLYYSNKRDTSTSGQYSQEGTFVTTRPKDPMHYAYPLLRKFVGWF
jgi:hypothetical protein